jgi:hypothetical protein
MTLFLVILLLLVVAGSVAYVVEERQRQLPQARQLLERLRIKHEQFVAQMRLQRLTQSALQRLLDEARGPRASEPSPWQ